MIRWSYYWYVEAAAVETARAYGMDVAIFITAWQR
jgi:hypothetical protein